MPVFYIAGAGISGLTLALALARFGASVVVLERNAGISEFGAGLQISPNARRILDRLGLDEALQTASFEPVGIDIFSSRTKLVTLELGPVMRERFGAPYTVMHRADLADALYQTTRRFANIDVQFGIKRWTAKPADDGVVLTITDAPERHRTARGRALIGADGVHSQTRRHLLAGPDAMFQGRAVWRALLPFDLMSKHIALDRVSVLLGPGHHIVCYPLPHRAEVNVAVFAKSSSQAADSPAFSSTLEPRAQAILRIGGGLWTPWPLYAVDTQDWHRGPIGLIGDAAHAMVPFQAQGAAMGIEDAATLAPLLMEHADAAKAFARYTQLRRDRVGRVSRASLSNGRIFHMHQPLGLARDAVIRLQGPRGHLRRLAWLYAHDAEVNRSVKTSG